MVHHHRRNSWASYLYLGGINSLTRAGGPQDIHLFDENGSSQRSQSSLSHVVTTDEPRDSWGKPLSTPKPSLPESPLSQEHKLGRFVSRSALKEKRSSLLKHSLVASRGDNNTSRRSRRASWLSALENSNQNIRRMLGNTLNNSSSPCRKASNIPSPTLIGTTNESVARTEGARHEELPHFFLSLFTWKSELGRNVANSRQSDVATGDLQDDATITRVSRTRNLTLAYADDHKKSLKDSKDSKDRFVNLRASISSRLHRPKSITDRNTVFKQGQYSELEYEPKTPEDLDQKIAQHDAETMNLQRPKIKELSPGGLHEFEHRAKSALLAYAASSGHCVKSNTSSEGGINSLMQSFASSLDKLDIFTSPTSRERITLRSESSCLTDESTYSDTFNHNRGDLSTRFVSSSVPALIGSDSQLLSASALMPQQSFAVVESSTTRPCYFSMDERQIVPSIKRNEKYPTGVNPLALHPEVISFVPDLRKRKSIYKKVDDRLVRTTPSFYKSEKRSVVNTGTSTSTQRFQMSDGDKDTASLENVPIYSPSLEELSQYSTKTPNTSSLLGTPAPFETCATNHKRIIPGTMEPTPTHVEKLQHNVPPSSNTSNHGFVELKSLFTSKTLFQKLKSQKSMTTPANGTTKSPESTSKRVIKKEDIGTPSPCAIERVSGFGLDRAPTTPCRELNTGGNVGSYGLPVTATTLLAKKDKNKPLFKYSTGYGFLRGKEVTTPSKVAPTRPERGDEYLGGSYSAGGWF